MSKLKKLTDDEMEQVAGGLDPNGFGLRDRTTKPMPGKTVKPRVLFFPVGDGNLMQVEDDPRFPSRG